jgi:hypothetical protein
MRAAPFLASVMIAALPACAFGAGRAPVVENLPAVAPAPSVVSAQLQPAEPPSKGSEVPASEAARMAEAIWAAAARMPEEKQARLKPDFLTMLEASGDRALLREWEKRLGQKAAAPSPGAMPYALARASETVTAHGWDGFLTRARMGDAPFKSGRPEIMAAGLTMAPDDKTYDLIIAEMLALAGAPGRGRDASENFERGDFGHVLAEAAMERCDLALFDRAVALTPEPASLRYAFWRARIMGGASGLAPQLSDIDGEGDSRPVRQAIEGYGAILKHGYCTQSR